MATTKKTTTTKAKASAVKKEVTNNEVVETVLPVEDDVQEEIAKSEVIKEVVKQKKVFTDSDYITCRSVWSGGLNVVSQSGNLYKFKDYGFDCDINYRDLVTMIKRGSEHVFLPRFVILDEDFLQDYPTVQRVYGTMYTKEDLLDILDLPVSRMRTEIEKLPKATKNSMRNLVSTQIANGKLDSISKVRALTEIFGSDFNLLSDLFVQR